MTINKTQFEKGLEGLRRVALSPRQKGEIFHTLHNYAEARPVPERSVLYAAFLKMFRGLYAKRLGNRKDKEL